MVTSTRQLRGAFTALVTPFASDGSLDERAFRSFVSWQILAGIDGLVPCGTTGESPTLSQEERDAVIGWTFDAVRARTSGPRVTVIAGTGSYDTAATLPAPRRPSARAPDAALAGRP